MDGNGATVDAGSEYSCGIRRLVGFEFMVLLQFLTHRLRIIIFFLSLLKAQDLILKFPLCYESHIFLNGPIQFLRIISYEEREREPPWNCIPVVSSTCNSFEPFLSWTVIYTSFLTFVTASTYMFNTICRNCRNYVRNDMSFNLLNPLGLY